MFYLKLFIMLSIWLVVFVGFCKHYLHEYKKLSERHRRELQRLNDENRAIVNEYQAITKML